MERHILCTVSDVTPSWGLRFVVNFFKQRSDLHVTLLYVVPTVFDTGAMVADVKLTEKQVQTGQRKLEESRQWAVERGMPEKQVHMKVVPHQQGVTRDIVNEAQKGLYDAVVVGRRYLGWAERMFTTSVSRGILWENIDFPVWVCNVPEADRKDILLCVDGSTASTRIADHVGFMLSGQTEHTVTLLHFEESGTDSEKVFAAPRTALLENGISEARISTMLTSARDKVQSILRIAQEDKYAVVAVGRRKDLPESLFRQMMTDSVSLKLHEEVSHFSLWVSK